MNILKKIPLGPSGPIIHPICFYLNESSPHLGLEKFCERIYDYKSAHYMHIIVLLKPRRTRASFNAFLLVRSKIQEKILDNRGPGRQTSF